MRTDYRKVTWRRRRELAGIYFWTAFRVIALGLFVMSILTAATYTHRDEITKATLHTANAILFFLLYVDMRDAEDA